MSRRPGPSRCFSGLALALLMVLAGAAGCVWDVDDPPLSPLAAAGEGPGVATAVARNLVLLTVDTYRGDHFGTERGGLELTPRLSAFAQGARRYTNAHSVGTATAPGVAGILTGLYAFRSGVVENRCVVTPPLVTLAERLRDAGFVTGAVVSNPVIGPGLGFDDGFDRYELAPRGLHKIRGEGVRDAGIAWLGERRPGERFFLWLHFMEPHGPYMPPPAIRDRLAPESFDGPTTAPLETASRQRGLDGIPVYQQHYHQRYRGLHAPSDDPRDYLARYAGEVRRLDDLVGDVLDALEEGGRLADTAVVLTADHGEALADDHGAWFSHGHGVTLDQVHVPLVVRAPGLSPAVVDTPVSTADVVPTALDLLGLPPAEDVDGRVLRRTGREPVVYESPSATALRSGDWKIAHDHRAGAWSLFDLAADPGEATDLASDEPRRLEALRDELKALRRGKPRIAKCLLRDDPRVEEKRKELEALGYL